MKHLDLKLSVCVRGREGGREEEKEGGREVRIRSERIRQEIKREGKENLHITHSSLSSMSSDSHASPSSGCSVGAAGSDRAG